MSVSDNRLFIGVLCSIINTLENFFIYEELENFSFYSYTVFCMAVKRLDKKIHYRCIPEVLNRRKNLRLWKLSQKDILRLRNIIHSKNIKLLYAEFLFDAVVYLPLIKKAGLPLVVNFRGVELSIPYVNRYLKELLSMTSQIIARSHFQREALMKKGVNEKKIKVIYGGINVDTIPFKFRNLDKNNLRLISAGRFVEKKGYDTTVKFFKDFAKKYPSSRLTLIGDGYLKNLIQKYVWELKLSDRVDIKSYMEHDKFIRELFNHDIFILPSKTSSTKDREGMPNVLKEVMASGMPVISTYHAGIPELICDQETGFLVKENDYRGIRDKIEFILSNKNKVSHICKKARSRIENKFNVKHSAHEVEGLFDRVLSHW